MKTYTLSFLTFLITFSLSANPFRELLLKCMNLTNFEKRVLRNWHNKELYKRRTKRMIETMKEIDYYKIYEKYDRDAFWKINESLKDK